MSTIWYEDHAERVAPLLAGEVGRVEPVLLAPNPDPDPVAYASAAPLAEALPVAAASRLDPDEEGDEDDDPGLPDLGLFREYGAEAPLAWEPPEEGEPASALRALGAALPVLRAQADANVLRVDDRAVHSLLAGTLRVEADPDRPGRAWIFLFTTYELTALRLHGGWVLAVERGDAVLFRGRPTLDAPPLADWPELRLPPGLDSADALDVLGLVLRHADFDVVDPVAVLLSGAAPPPVERARAWLAAVATDKLTAACEEAVRAAEGLLAGLERGLDATWAATLRDVCESHLRALALAERVDGGLAASRAELAELLARIDARARSLGLAAAALAPTPRLRAASLDVPAGWWGRV